MTTLIIITAYILYIFICRYLTYLSVKNQGKILTVSYGNEWVWFVPILGILWGLFDFIASLLHRNKKHSNWFTGKNW